MEVKSPCEMIPTMNLLSRLPERAPKASLRGNSRFGARMLDGSVVNRVVSYRFSFLGFLVASIFTVLMTASSSCLVVV